MLCSISITNFLLIERLEFDFRSGLSVITGETGAGKSILVDAILFAFGQKPPRRTFIPQAKRTTVILGFSPTIGVCAFLELREINFDQNEVVLLKRTVIAGSADKFFINEQHVTKKTALELMYFVVEIHGQHNYITLFDVKAHRDILDEYAGHVALQRKVESQYKELLRLEKCITQTEQQRQRIDRKIEYLEYSCAELADAKIRIGEAQELHAIKCVLQSREKELSMISSILNSLHETRLSEVVTKARKDILRSQLKEKYLESDLLLEGILDQFEEVKNQIKLIGNQLREPEDSLQDVDDRLDLIKSFARKYSCQPDELATVLESHLNELSALRVAIIDSEQNVRKYAEVKQNYLVDARSLSKSREHAGKQLEAVVNQELHKLEMSKARFRVLVNSSEEDISQNGIDKALFYATTNPGMPERIITEIASGGELSRLMLALRAALFSKASSQNVNKTIIFDEIDVGIAGSVAESIGDKFKSMSCATQILVVTHQAQVAGKADHHILVKKLQDQNQTMVEIRFLDGEDKFREIARMISGKRITENALKAAEELVN